MSLKPFLSQYPARASLRPPSNPGSTQTANSSYFMGIRGWRSFKIVRRVRLSFPPESPTSILSPLDIISYWCRALPTALFNVLYIRLGFDKIHLSPARSPSLRELCTILIFGQFWSLREASEPLAASKTWRDVAPPRRGFARNDNTGVKQRSSCETGGTA